MADWKISSDYRGNLPADRTPEDPSEAILRSDTALYADVGDGRFRIIASRPEFRHFEETGWTDILSWSGTARDLLREACEIEGFVGNFMRPRSERQPVPESIMVAEEGPYGGRRTAEWRLTESGFLKDNRHVSDEEAVKALGWIVCRMTQHEAPAAASVKTKDRDDLLGVLDRLLPDAAREAGAGTTGRNIDAPEHDGQERPPAIPIAGGGPGGARSR